MAVFNSLGSNYSGAFIWRSLFARKSKTARRLVEKNLGELYDGSATLTYKGRDALELALRRSDLPSGSAIGISGFTCYVVYQAVVNAGYEAVFIDVGPKQLNFGIKELERAHRENPNLAAIIIQNTLGYPADGRALSDYCRQHKLMIIEDLAHSMGTVYEDGREAGTIGAFTMLSFSQDKPLDVVAGGVLIDRRVNETESPAFEAPSVTAWQRSKNRWYPFWTNLIRSLYGAGIGRVLHYALKHLKLLSTPMSDNITGLHRMSPSTPALLLPRLRQAADELSHRRQIAGIYQDNLPAELRFSTGSGEPAYLRFPLWADNRTSLIGHLRQSRIYIGDTWYDAPIAPKRYMARTNYEQGDCPNAEALAEHIVNLPTHRHITPQIARNICAKIKQWQASTPDR